MRTISLNQMARLLTLQDVEFVNLQYGDTSEERKKFKKEFGIEIINFDNLDLMSDFESLSALIASCDLVITITNITSQFSGAIGKKTWVIIPLNTQWHWFHKRENSLWYPRIKLFNSFVLIRNYMLQLHWQTSAIKANMLMLLGNIILYNSHVFLFYCFD